MFHFWIHFGSLSLAAFQQQRAVRGKKQAATTVNTLKIIFPSSYGLWCNGTQRTGEIGAPGKGEGGARLCDPIGYEQPNTSNGGGGNDGNLTKGSRRPRPSQVC